MDISSLITGFTIFVLAVFVGFDAVDDAVNAVKAGDLQATVAQQPAVIGELGGKSAVSFLNGKKVESFIPVPLSLVSP